MRYKRHGDPEYLGVTLEGRIYNNSSPDANGCWIWNSKKNKAGYGLIKIDGSYKRAHRVSYELFIGEIPDGLLVCHKCDVRECINPDHLFIGTHKENTQDMISKGRGYWPGPINHPRWKKSKL